MKKWFKISLVLVIALFVNLNLNAQNKKISINAEQVEDGVKVVTVEDGKTSEFVFNMEEAEEYLKQFGGSIDFDIDDNGDNNYKISYATDDGQTETLEIDLGSILENLSIDVSKLTEDLKKMATEIAKEIEYEETIDENGNKSIKIKSSTDE